MNIKEYISSGIIESYVLGLTTQEENREVEEMAAKHPEIQNEIDETSEALKVYAQAHSKTPPEGLKSKIIKKLCGEEFEANSKVVHVESSDRKRYKLAAAAAIALLIISAGLNYIFYDNWQKATEQVSAMVSEKEVLAEEKKNIQARFAKAKEKLEVINSPENKIIKLEGLKKAPQSLATVFWNQSTKAVYLDVNHLPKPPAGKQYQLWCLLEGQPVSMGVFEADTGEEEIQKMKNALEADGFAVTLEDAGGSPSPTMEQLYLMGNIS